MFKKNHVCRIKGYEELKEEENTMIDGETIYTETDDLIYLEAMDKFKNTLISTDGETMKIGNYYFQEWMCEDLGEVIEPLEKFEVGGEYEVLSWNELLRVRGVTLSPNGDKLCKNNNNMFKNTMLPDVIKDSIKITIETNINKTGNVRHHDWVVSPWMCKAITYSTSEVIAMLEKNKSRKFECYVSNLNSHHLLSVDKDNYITIQQICDDGNIKECWNGNIRMDYRWREIKQKSVTFEEALNSGKPVRVEHKLIDNWEWININDGLIKQNFNNFINNKYVNMSSLMTILGYKLSSLELAEVINNGKWYVKEWE